MNTTIATIWFQNGLILQLHQLLKMVTTLNGPGKPHLKVENLPTLPLLVKTNKDNQSGTHKRLLHQEENQLSLQVRKPINKDKSLTTLLEHIPMVKLSQEPNCHLQALLHHPFHIVPTELITQLRTTELKMVDSAQLNTPPTLLMENNMKPIHTHHQVELDHGLRHLGLQNKMVTISLISAGLIPMECY
jgi:hypothetical protein